MAFSNITQSQLNSRGATTLPNQPTISPQALKEEFDAPAKQIVAPAFNNLVTSELPATTAASNIGAVAPTGRTGDTVQAVINSVSSAVDSKSTIAITNVSTSGVRIATVSINGTATDLKAPQGGQGTMDYGDLTNKPSINSTTLSGNKSSSDLGLAAASHTHTKSDITDLPTLATVATTGAYSDLSGTPSLATVATSGSYNDLSNKPTIPDELADLSDDSTHRLVTDTEKTTWNGKSTVTWNQQVTTGQKIATVSIDGTPTDVYAPNGGGGGGGGNVDSVNGQQGVVVLGVADIDGVDITSLADQHTLVYDGTDTEWQNKALANVALSGAYSDLSGKPTLATVATSGSYNDLSNKPTIPTVTDAYSGSSSDAMSGKAVKSAIDALDATPTGAGSGKTITALSQTNGIIAATFGNISITKSQVSDFPTIPTVNDATLTIQQNGVSKGTFTANASSNATANIVTDEFVANGSPSSGSVTFSGIDDTVNSGACGYDVYFDITSNSSNKAPYAKLTSISGEGTSNMSLTYETDADNGTNTAHLRQVK